MATNYSKGNQHADKQRMLCSAVALTIALTLTGCGGNTKHSTTTTTTTHFPVDTIILDAINSSGVSQLLIAANPLDPDGDYLPEQKLLLLTGVSILGFCEQSFKDNVSILQTPMTGCAVFGQKQQAFWGYLYKGLVHIPSGNLHIDKAYYAIEDQQVKVCNADVHGIFGIAFQNLNPASNVVPGWAAGHVGHCPKPVVSTVKPFLQYLNVDVQKIGIYWSGIHGAGEGKLFINDDAINNPYYDEAMASSVGKAELGSYGSYEVNVQSVEYNGKSIKNLDCATMEDKKCRMDTGTPAIIVPKELFEEITTGQTGDLIVSLAGKAELKFDVKTLLDNQWVQPSETQVVILGLPLQAFYYTIMDIGNSVLEFVPMAKTLDFSADSEKIEVVV